MISPEEAADILTQVREIKSGLETINHMIVLQVLQRNWGDLASNQKFDSLIPGIRSCLPMH